MKEGLKMKQKSFSSATLLTGVAAFIVFLVAACAAYYMTAGVFVTAQIAAVYAVLGALGALALLFRRKLFALFFYVGCVLGWLSGHFVGGLEGDFAPTAGLICTFGLILLFAVLGSVLEWKAFRRRRRKEQARLERQQKEDAAREEQLIAQQAAKADSRQNFSSVPGQEAPAAQPPEDGQAAERSF